MKGDGKRARLEAAMRALGPDAPLDRIAFEAGLTRGGCAALLRRMGAVRTQKSRSHVTEEGGSLASRWTLPAVRGEAAASPVLGTILLLGVLMLSFGSALAVVTGWCPDGVCWTSVDQRAGGDLSWHEARERCRCEPLADADGSPCEPVSLPDRYGVAWRCEVKPVLMRPTRAVGA